MKVVFEEFVACTDIIGRETQMMLTFQDGDHVVYRCPVCNYVYAFDDGRPAPSFHRRNGSPSMRLKPFAPRALDGRS